MIRYNLEPCQLQVRSGEFAVSDYRVWFRFINICFAYQATGVCSLVRVEQASCHLLSEDFSNEIGKNLDFIHAVVKTSVVEFLTPLNVRKFVDNSAKRAPRQCIELKLFMTPPYVTFGTFAMFVIVA